FADIRAVMENTGSALMGIGSATGEKRAENAAMAAINSPLLEVSIHGARGVLFAIAGNDDLTMHEIQDAARVITESIDSEAKVIFGTIKNEKLKKGEIKVTVIASGFPENLAEKTLFESKGKEVRKDKGTLTINTEPQIQKPPVSNIKPASDDDDWSSVPAFLRRSKLK
ncbi:MAG: cell division protein FtsZ, partial [Patescibacteria group bacterium]|nr:cell division protein FtsZ [Patescibacteria group bacterium]